jgi:hypothetical protein
VRGVELRALCMLGKHFTPELHPQPHPIFFFFFIDHRSDLAHSSTSLSVSISSSTNF